MQTFSIHTHIRKAHKYIAILQGNKKKTQTKKIFYKITLEGEEVQFFLKQTLFYFQKSYKKCLKIIK